MEEAAGGAPAPRAGETRGRSHGVFGFANGEYVDPKTAWEIGTDGNLVAGKLTLIMRQTGLLLIASLAFAQTGLRTRTGAGLDSIDITRLKADLTFLSSDALEGRRSLERGSEVAIQWIASEFAKSGLKPLVGDSYLQPVPIIEFTADRERTSLGGQIGPTLEAYPAPDATPNYSNKPV